MHDMHMAVMEMEEKAGLTIIIHVQWSGQLTVFRGELSEILSIQVGQLVTYFNLHTHTHMHTLSVSTQCTFTETVYEW